MIDFKKLFDDNKILLAKLDNLSLVEDLFIKKYGSEEKAREVFKEILKTSKKDNNLQELLLAEFSLDSLFAVLDTFNKASNLTETLQNLEVFKSNANISKEIHDNINIVKSVSDSNKIPEVYKDSFIAYINQNVTFTLANTRKELGYPHPRIFNPWLNFFFDNKYKSRTLEKGRSAGKITLSEYVEIVSAFILSYDEKKLDFSNPKKMLERFEFQQKTQKQFLKNREGYYYSKLREKLKDINLSSNYQANFKNKPFDLEKRKIPYILFSIIEEDLNNCN
ncbi:hypothetical protein [Mesoflavibacter sp. CH_XMU1404-2]|uniref:hypothetical protein n=1 Tax=Mesoflavibacter sp. CH_XMU1404-2 TaxID=3107766 RepID=UPI003008DAB0